MSLRWDSALPNAPQLSLPLILSLTFTQREQMIIVVWASWVPRKLRVM